MTNSLTAVADGPAPSMHENVGILHRMPTMQLQPWRAKKLDDGIFAYLVPDAEIKSDGGKMCVHVVAATERLDRERDILVVKGADLTNHRNNPAVLLNHRRDLPLVARCEDRDGNYTVKCVGNELHASNYFIQKGPAAKMALQVFRMIESGALRGVSPGFLTRPGGVHKVKAADGHPALLYDNWELVEVTHCPIGMNGENLVMSIEKGFGADGQMVPELKEALLPFVPERPAMVTSGYVAKSVDDLADLDGNLSDDIDLSDAEVPPLTSSTAFYHANYAKAFDGHGLTQELAGAQELERTKADSKAIMSHYGAILDICQKGLDGHIQDHPDQPGLPGSVHEYAPAKMAEYRVKAMDLWDKFREELAVDRQSCAAVKRAVEFLQLIGNDPTQKAAVRPVAKSLVRELSKVKMVEVPDDHEELVWGEINRKLAGVG